MNIAFHANAAPVAVFLLLSLVSAGVAYLMLPRRPPQPARAAVRARPVPAARRQRRSRLD